MNSISMLVVLTSVLLLATLSDLRTRRIPNWLTFGAALLGALLQWRLGGAAGLGTALAGLIVGLGCFLPSYLFGALGGGDVKLMAAAGCFLGPMATPVAAICAVLMGGVLALTRITLRGGFKPLAARYGAMMVALVCTRRLIYLAPAGDEPAAERFPYALAIAAGTLISVAWMA